MEIVLKSANDAILGSSDDGGSSCSHSEGAAVDKREQLGSLTEMSAHISTLMISWLRSLAVDSAARQNSFRPQG